MRQELVRRLSTLPSGKKLEALIEAPDAKALVRSVPAEELYYAIVDVGLADSADIVQLASPEQFRAFVDLGGWKRDRLEPHQVLTWLRAARGDDPEDFLPKLDKLDLEVLELMLRSFITVHDLEEDPDVNPEGVTMESPEGKYLFEFHVEGVELAALRAMLHDLLGRNPLETARLFEAIRWEVPSELEETAFRFRSARLEDLGFPPLERAVSLFAWKDPDKVTWDRPSQKPGSALVQPQGRVNYLDAALRDLSENERENFEQELRGVANAALVAEVQDPGDLDAVRTVGEMVRDYLSLGLEHLTGGDPALAADCVRELEARTLLQVGFSLTLRLKFRADRLARVPLALLGDLWLTLPDEANALAALRRKRPLRTLKVEGAEPVPFRSRKELEASHQLLDRAEAQVRIFRAVLGGDEDAARLRLAAFGRPEVLDTRKVLAAAVAHAVLDGTAMAAPLRSSRVPELCERLFEGTDAAPVLRTSATQRAHQAFDEVVAAEDQATARALVDQVLENLRCELGEQWLAEGTLDPSVAELLPISPVEAL